MRWAKYCAYENTTNNHHTLDDKGDSYKYCPPCGGLSTVLMKILLLTITRKMTRVVATSTACRAVSYSKYCAYENPTTDDHTLDDKGGIYKYCLPRGELSTVLMKILLLTITH